MSLLTKSDKPSKPIKWTIGIITAPRTVGLAYLPRTLASLKRTGWENPVIFAEPGSPIPNNLQMDVVHRRHTYGDWTNWATGLFELLLSEPDTDYFMMVEDDVVFAQSVRIYIEGYLSQLEPFGSLSLYCPNQYQRTGPAFSNRCDGWNTCTTQTVIMSKNSVISFFAYHKTVRHRFEHVFDSPKEEIPWGVRVNPCNSVKDSIIGTWAKDHHLPVFFHHPSLAQHIGTDSTLGCDHHYADDFVGEDIIPEWDRVIKIIQTRDTWKTI